MRGKKWEGEGEREENGNDKDKGGTNLLLSGRGPDEIKRHNEGL